MADEDTQTVTLKEAMTELQARATSEGRCPQCGRRHDDSEAALFDELRSELASARTERDEAVAEAKVLQDSNVLFESEVTALKQKLAEAE